MKLYGVWLSSCAWRVRLALLFKGLPFEYTVVKFPDGQHCEEEYLKINPLGLVPSLETEDGVFADSIAILEYLEEKYPDKALLPSDIGQRAAIRQVVNLIASNIQPLQNGGRVLNVIKEKLGDEESLLWAQHWIITGFTALEKILEKTSGRYSFGHTITLADIVLVPQLRNAERLFKVDMAPFPTLVKLKEELFKLEEVQLSLPELQPDAPK